MIKEYQAMVENLLHRFPPLRDSDTRLIANIWSQTLIDRGLNTRTMSGYDLFMELAQNQLPSYESISRCRRKLQEENKNLRGKLYNKRHQMQKEVISDIQDMTGRNNMND